MKKSLYVLIALTLLFGAFAGGMKYGFNVGVENYHHLENVLSSNVDVLRAMDLKGGSEKELKHIYWEYENSINRAIDSYNWYQNSGNHVFSKVFLSGHLENLDKSIINLSRYRREHPVEMETDVMVCELSEAETQRALCLERLEKRRDTVNKYGAKS
ncbi:hypothetical protein [Saccharophagus degradans]|uniref:Uncharacterized protein n=1 Tax=Saccharophagus degradans (strain 2-40 / ATCC 43961 / DSM 17024) TaxID=203122 RepID=Q21JP3_SACD2|nr:hypothetical protein [Saccharophagus degradans]ABD81086.1 hypothetical protein Sde_1826 [Saccharophagus degradans 2-40]